MSTETDVVQCETPQGTEVLAKVVDREPQGSFGNPPEDILTVEAEDTSWRVSGSEVERL